MRQQDLRALYLSDTEKAPEIRDAISEASKSPDRTLTLEFRPFDDDPMLLYAVWGLASSMGVTLVLPPDR